MNDWPAVRDVVGKWVREKKVDRIWGKDASVWTSRGEEKWLGWLDLDRAAPCLPGGLAAGIRHVVLLGMGGSSLAPEVLAATCARRPGFPELIVLDSVVPAQVLSVERRIDFAKTLFIVASKSGTTIEPDVLREYFFARAGTGRRFVAITDPGSKLEEIAKRDGYAAVFHGVPSVGGRFSALSNFGIVPAALAGIEVGTLLARAAGMAASCARAESNPGVLLGAAWGVLAREGRDKLTIVASPSYAAFGAWLEQLVAESTGKAGRGIVPVDEERLGPPEAYGSDRLFLYMRDKRGPSSGTDRAVEALERAGHPVFRIEPDGPEDLGAEFFRCEMATAVAGSILGINPFDQPDVEAAKVAARQRMAAGILSSEPPQFDEGALIALLRGLRPGDYFAIQAYVERCDASHEPLQAIRHAVWAKTRVATTLGYGPRFLHSTGQLHKGGPETGVFLQITSEDAEDLPVPGRPFTFGALKRAQAAGDLEVLLSRGRRVLRVHLGPDVPAGLRRLRDAVGKARLAHPAAI